jgi:hypothetical protein
MTGITRAWAAALLIAVLVPLPPLATVAGAAPKQGPATGEGSSKDGSLRAQVSPSQGFAPAAVRIKAQVQPDAVNRELEVVIESASYYRSSTIELSGAQAARAHDVVFLAVPAGSHEVRVVLRDSGGEVRAILYHRVTLYE